MKCTWLSGRLWISRSTSNSRSLFASITRKRFKFRSKDKPCDSTCSGVELSLLVDTSSSRLGIFLRERNATITKKSREEGFWRYAVRKDFWDGRRSIFHKGQNKYNQRRPYLPVLSGKNEAFSGFWDSLWVFSLSGRKNVMSMRELFCPDPLAGFEKMAGFQIFYCLKIRCFHS